ncbi:MULTISPECIES: GreA/GreB family elongation factor [Robiginitalea]|uniref:Transcription elongation factor GreA/GreB C-terminal domain-containing protein n=1 Tax=Robiginitalea biformata (strain ATCC BAA-864 / DSM 15991 / KCTC 12146 / HTCC2501) TaxID=313596 RepID=A4CMC2_ROBBH|nr:MULTISPECIES: GreA/GreB family elongation factor [Robiginitalea]EAR14814.1 hypothetical protein RB2501_10827 [Robiginitalea biformata HTCC2501]MDC6355334.1 GreA/GreB family elongation factor [Robiginitalea sp. PM2]MDC6375451.1 GreA/GreB family elongation factor [Robiginitalea sp. SP8]
MMKYGKLVFERQEYDALLMSLEANRVYDDYAHQHAARLLKRNMASALILDQGECPDDVVRPDVWVTLKGVPSYRRTVRLASSGKPITTPGDISVISALGASIIGRSEGDVILFGQPGNTMSLTIAKISSNHTTSISLAPGTSPEPSTAI